MVWTHNLHMKLENQVVSLDIAKRLKELGVKQESLFWWLDFDNTACTTKDGKGFETHRFQALYDEPMLFDMEERDHIGIHDKYSAFTVAELGQLLRDHTYRENLVGFPTPNRVDEKGEGWQINKLGGIIDCSTEADARGKCLIYLLENKLITL